MAEDWQILVTNDDGIAAPGLLALAGAAAELGIVTVVAPATEQSATSHSLTVRTPVKVEQVRPGWHAVHGTPTDCVNIAFFQILDRLPDLVLSGINAGYNLGEDVTYSGTVAGALEARLLGAPAIAVSTAPAATAADYATAARVALQLARDVLSRGLPLDALLNVNVPPRPDGFRITRQGRRLLRNGIRADADPPGSSFYWVGLAPSEWMPEPGADHTAIAEGKVSVTPLHADLTFHRALPILLGWGLPEGGPGADQP